MYTDVRNMRGSLGILDNSMARMYGRRARATPMALASVTCLHRVVRDVRRGCVGDAGDAKPGAEPDGEDVKRR